MTYKKMLGNFLQHYGQAVSQMQELQKMLGNTLPNIFNQLANEIFETKDCDDFELKHSFICDCGYNTILVWKIERDTDTPNEDAINLVCSDNIDRKFDDVYMPFTDLDIISQWQIVKQLAEILNIQF